MMINDYLYINGKVTTGTSIERSTGKQVRQQIAIYGHGDSLILWEPW